MEPSPPSYRSSPGNWSLWPGRTQISENIRPAPMSFRPSDGLPPRELWPDLIFDRPELQYPRTLNVAEALLGSGPHEERADRVALIHRDTTFSYAALRNQVVAFT